MSGDKTVRPDLILLILLLLLLLTRAVANKAYRVNDMPFIRYPRMCGPPLTDRLPGMAQK